MPPQRHDADSIRRKDLNRFPYYLINYSRSSLNIDTVFDLFQGECVEMEVVEKNHPQQGKCLLCLLHYRDKQHRETDYCKLNDESANMMELETKTDVNRQRHIIRTNPTAFRTNWGEVKQNGGSRWSKLNSATYYETAIRIAHELYPKDYIYRRSQIESHLS